MLFLSVDLETTGLNHKECQILEIAAVLADTCNLDSPVESFPVFHRKIFWKQIRGEPYALWINRELIKAIPPEKTDEYIFVHEIWTELANWLEKKGFSDKNKLTLAGKNFGMFDSKFLNEVPIWNWSWFRHRILDPGMLYFNPMRDATVPDSKECIKRAKINWDESKLHTAVDDARLVVELLRHGFRVNN